MNVELRVGNRAFTGWTSMQVECGIEQAARTFEVSIAGAYREGVYADDNVVVLVSDPARSSAEPLRLVTGVVDRVSIAGDGNSTRVVISGRSSTREACDCSVPAVAKTRLPPTALRLIGQLRALPKGAPLPPELSSALPHLKALPKGSDIDLEAALLQRYAGSWASKKLRDVVASWLMPYQIGLVDEAGIGNEVMQYRAQLGESIFDALDKLCREKGALVMDDEFGRLVLTRTGGRGKATDKIVRGTAGFISGEAAWDVSERYSHYSANGQQFTDLEVNPAVTGLSEDAGISRFRELIVVPEKGLSPKDAQRRAEWEATTRAAKGFDGTYVVQGWHQSDGALWRPNTLVGLVDGAARIFDEELLIVSAGYSLTNEGGRRTTLRLGPPKGYEPPPARTVSADIGGVGVDLESTAPEDDE